MRRAVTKPGNFYAANSRPVREDGRGDFGRARRGIGRRLSALVVGIDVMTLLVLGLAIGPVAPNPTRATRRSAPLPPSCPMRSGWPIKLRGPSASPCFRLAVGGFRGSWPWSHEAAGRSRTPSWWNERPAKSALGKLARRPARVHRDHDEHRFGHFFAGIRVATARPHFDLQCH